MKENIYYRKVGRKYEPVAYFEPEGLPAEGLWYIHREKGSHGAMNMGIYCKVHDIQEVGRFCDLYKAHYDKIVSGIQKNMEEFIKKLENKGYSYSDLTNVVLKTLSEIK